MLMKIWYVRYRVSSFDAMISFASAKLPALIACWKVKPDSPMIHKTIIIRCSRSSLYTLRFASMYSYYCIYSVVYRNAKLCWCFADDHHPPPTFTPPELPKKVHVRGTSQAQRAECFILFVFLFIIGPHFSIDQQCASSLGYRKVSCT